MSKIISIILKLHPQLLALVIFGNLESYIPKALFHCINRPSLHSWPTIGDTLHYDGLVRLRGMLIEPLRCDVASLHSCDGPRLLIINNGPGETLILERIAELIPF